MVLTCSVYDCAHEAQAVMKWPEGSDKNPMYLCFAHKLWYMGIIGPHMRIEALEPAV